MRAIDADALITDISELIFVKDALCEYEQVQGLEIALQYIDETPTIEPERKKGRWEIYVISMIDGEGCRCSECSAEGVPYWDFCPNCGAEMSDSVEIARDIVHEAIDNSVWSDTVDVSEMHKVVDDKYAEMTEDNNL